MINPEDIHPEAISRLALMLRQGFVAVYPTETFYALGVAPTRAEAVERIFAIKGRDFRKALPLYCLGQAGRPASGFRMARNRGTVG